MSKELGVTDLDEVDLVLGAEGLDELNVLGFRAGFDKDAKMGLSLVQGLCSLTKTTSKAIVNESVLQDLL